MAPARPGQLDEISEAIGRLSGHMESLDRYTHEREHGLNNLAQKVDGLGVKIASDIAGLRAEIRADLDSLSTRVAKLEAADIRAVTTKGNLIWVLQSPLLAWLTAAAVMLAAWWKKP